MGVGKGRKVNDFCQSLLHWRKGRLYFLSNRVSMLGLNIACSDKVEAHEIWLDIITNRQDKNKCKETFCISQ